MSRASAIKSFRICRLVYGMRRHKDTTIECVGIQGFCFLTFRTDTYQCKGAGDKKGDVLEKEIEEGLL